VRRQRSALTQTNPSNRCIHYIWTNLGQRDKPRTYDSNDRRANYRIRDVKFS
jgi:hypothetical protein